MTRLRSHSNFSNKASGLSSFLLGLRGIFRVTSMPQISALSHQTHRSQVSAPFEPDPHLLPSLSPARSVVPISCCLTAVSPALELQLSLLAPAWVPGGVPKTQPKRLLPSDALLWLGWGRKPRPGSSVGAGVPAPTPEPQSVSSDGCGQRSLGTDPGSKSLTQPSCAGGGGGTRGSPRARLPAMNQAAQQSQLAQTRARR